MTDPLPLDLIAPWEAGFPPAATRSDILFCFRLLLGRWPQAHEWPGHSGFEGLPLPAVVASYLDSLEFKNRHLGSNTGLDVERVDLDGFSMFAGREDPYIGKIIIDNHAYEPAVTRVFTEVLRRGDHVIDIGANIGFFSLLSSVLVGPTGSVFAFEPGPVNVKLLCASRQLNEFKQLSIVQAAASDDVGPLAYGNSFSNGFVDELRRDSADSILSGETVMGLRIEQIVPPSLPIRLIKIDVEGHEYKALRGAETIIRRWKPAIVTEFSPEALSTLSRVSGREYLGYLVGFGYELSVLHDSGPKACGTDVERIMTALAERGSEHIDLLAAPPPGAGEST